MDPTRADRGGGVVVEELGALESGRHGCNSGQLF